MARCYRMSISRCGRLIPGDSGITSWFALRLLLIRSIENNTHHGYHSEKKGYRKYGRSAAETFQESE